MNKNTLIGLLLIGAVLIGFTMYSGSQQKKQQEIQRKIDSVAYVNFQAEQAILEATKLSDATKISEAVEIKSDIYKSAELNSAIEGVEEFFTLENDKIIARISTKGGAIKSVELKDYKTYKNEPLYLFKEKNATFNLMFYTNVPVNTSNFYFKNNGGNINISQEGEVKSMTMTLPLSATASIDYIYTIKTGSNIVDFAIKMSGTNDILSPGQGNLFLDWSNISPQQEKGFSYENTRTTIGYMYPNEDSMDELTMSEGSESEDAGNVKWFAFKQQFFSSVLIANETMENVLLSYNTFPAGSGNIKQFNAKVELPYSINTQQYDFSFYFGPNEYSELKDLGNNLEKLVPLGWGIFGWVNRFIVIPTFNFLGEYINSYGIIILLLTIFIKVLLFGFTYKSYRSMAKMRILKPEIDTINAKFPKKEDAMKKQQATMELYRKAGVNPLGGCIPMLFQMPIIYAMYQFFPASIELRGKSFLWADDLSSYDSILSLPFDIPLYGNHVSLFALLMGISVIISSKMNMQNSSGSSQQLPGMQFMMVYIMPVMLVVWFNSYSSGLSYYYLVSNIITIGQTLIIRRFVSDDKLNAQMKANATKKRKKKSKWATKYEDMVKQQDQMRKQQQLGGNKKK